MEQLHSRRAAAARAAGGSTPGKPPRKPMGLKASVQEWSSRPTKYSVGGKPLTMCTGLLIGGIVLVIALGTLTVVEVTRGSSSSSSSSSSSGPSQQQQPGTNPNGPAGPSTDPMIQRALGSLGTGCNALTGAGCHPGQMAVTKPTQPQAWPTTPVLTATAPGAGITKTVLDTFTMRATGGLVSSLSDYSTKTSSGFGIKGSFPISAVAFGGGYAAKQVFSNLEQSSSKTYTTRMDAVAEQVMVSYDPVYTLAASADLSADIQVVIDAGRSMSAWKKFANKHGTHYVSSVTFGGIVSSFSSITSEGSSFTTAELNTHSESLSLGFKSFAGISASHTTQSGTTSTQAQQQWQSSSTLSVRGGDSGKAAAISSDNPGSLAAWVGTVTTDNSVVTGTTLKSIATLFPATAQQLAEDMLTALVSQCPSSTEPSGRVACAGVGRCQFNVGGVDTCVCPNDYLGASCNVTHIPCSTSCYPNGWCDYTTGTCSCSYGWTGDGCDELCGTFNFNYPSYYQNGQSYAVAAQVSNGGDEGAGQQQQAGNCACENLLKQTYYVSSVNAQAQMNSGSTRVAGNSARTGVTNALFCGMSTCSDSAIWHGNWGCQYFAALTCLAVDHPTCP